MKQKSTQQSVENNQKLQNKYKFKILTSKIY